MNKMTTDSLTPIQRLRKPLSGLILAMTQCGVDVDDVEYQDVCSAYLEVEYVFNSPEFRRYRESCGKLALMARSPGRVDCGFDNFREFLGHWDAINQSISTHGRIRLIDVSGLYTRLQIIEYDHKHIDEIFSR